MSLLEYEEAAALLRSNPTLFLCTGPCDEALVTLAERTLEVTFPETYRRFVIEFGSSPWIAGLIDDTFETAFRNDAVGETLRCRRNWGLPANYLGIIMDDYDGDILCFDINQIQDGDGPLFSYLPGLLADEQSWELIEPSFGGRLLDDVKHQIETRKAQS